MFNKYEIKTQKEEKLINKEFTKICNTFNEIFTIKKENKIDKGLEVSAKVDVLFQHIEEYRIGIKSDLDTLAYEILSVLYSDIEKDKAFNQYAEFLKGNREPINKKITILDYFPVAKKEKLFEYLVKFDHYCYLMLIELHQLKIEVAKELAKDYNVQDILMKMEVE